MKTLTAIFIFLVVATGLVFLAYLQPEPVVTAQVQPTALPVEIGPGVYLPLSYIQSIVGSRPVRVIAAPDGMARKTTMPDGRLEIVLPGRFGSGLAALTVPEAQEHVLRQLMQTDGDIALDAGGAILDDAILGAMASAPIARNGPQSEVFHTYLDAELAKAAIENQRILAQHALDKQAEVAEAGLDTAAKIAISGDMSQSWIASCWPAGLIVLAVAWMAVRGVFRRDAPAGAPRDAE